jgi:pilus assembly protein CpaF
MAFSELNIILITFIVAIVLIIIYFIFKKELEAENNKITDVYSLDYLSDVVKLKISEIAGENIYELKINKKETKKREHQKARLNKATRNCAQGNVGEREYMKDMIKRILQDDYGINERTIDMVIPFHMMSKLSSQDKFEILYNLYNREKDNTAFSKLNDKCNFDRERRNEYGTYYEISSEDVHAAYSVMTAPLRFVDKLEVVAQRIYQEGYGNSVADILRYDKKIDGISGGVSGASSEQYNFMEEAMESSNNRKAMTYNSIWIFYRGKAIHLSFLSFKDDKDLIRVCKNLYRFGSVGHLTSKIGYKLSYQADGCRVVVIRPIIATHWAFFLRKFDSAKNLSIEDLLIDDGKEYVITLSKWAARGCLNLVISGDQNSGKTTFFKALAVFFDRRNPIRTMEQEFEIWLNSAYTSLNAVCLRASEDVPLFDVIAIAKKMDAAIMMLGEIGNFEYAGGYLSLCQAGTRSTVATIHTTTTPDLIDYMKNGGMYTNLFRSEIAAEEQIAKSIQIDIHWAKTPEGKRYISYINEIVPLFDEYNDNGEEPLTQIANTLRLMSRKRAYQVRPLIVYEEGRYVIQNVFSSGSINRILRNLSQDDVIEFSKEMIELQSQIDSMKGEEYVS